MPYQFALIHNPEAGEKKSAIVKQFMKRCKKEGILCTYYETKEDLLPAACAQKAVREGATALICAGGDGTVNQVGEIASQYHIPMGILPVGSGNDTARAYSISLDPERALEQIFTYRTKKVDVGYANEHFFLNIASVGFDADVVAKKSTLPGWIPPSMGYRLSVLLLMLTYKEHTFSISSDAFQRKQKGLLCAVGIGRFYGGGVEILPDAVIDDGSFSVRFIEDISILERFQLLPALQFGNHLTRFEKVHTFATKEVALQTNHPVYLNVDGEIIEGVNEVTFTIHPLGIEVFA